MLDTNILGNRIKELRKQRGLTQNQFAEKLHVSFQAVSNWERGIAPPDLENLLRIADYFGILVDRLLRLEQEDLFLGIDGGGTKTEFVAVSSDGRIQKRIVKGGSNPNDIGYTEMLSLLSEGIEEILSGFQSVKAIFCGIAGISTGDYGARLYSDLKKQNPHIELQIKNDCFNLFSIDDADMAVISGTGSVVFVKDGDGYKRLGGWGYLLDHSGSGYDIGRDALCRALHEEDMKKPSSLLSQLLREKMDTATVWDQVGKIYSKGRPYIASLASVVFDAYRQGDAEAVGIIDKNAKGLSELLNSGVELYGVRSIAVASGGIFEHFGDIMIPHIEKYSNVRLNVSKVAPVYGACKNALTAAGHEPTDDFYENFKKTY